MHENDIVKPDISKIPKSRNVAGKRTDEIKKRKNSEHQWSEYVIALIILYPQLNFGEIKNLEYPIKNLEVSGKNNIEKKDNFSKYKESLLNEDPTVVKSYINKFKQSCHLINEIKDVCKVYLTGKKSYINKINELNKNIHNSKCKSDIYFETFKGVIAGLSIKKTIEATKTNLSLEKLLKEQDPTATTYLVNTRRNMIEEEGFNSSAYPRKLINEKFQKPNLYYDKCEEVIEKYNDYFKEQLIDRLYLKNFPYKIYEFDGNSLQEITGIKIKLSDCTFKKYNYITKSGKPRKAAKLFYLLSIKNDKIIKQIRIELRFKGNIWGSSAQFLSHIED
jgi:hypothetical protein